MSAEVSAPGQETESNLQIILVKETSSLALANALTTIFSELTKAAPTQTTARTPTVFGIAASASDALSVLLR